MCSPYEFRRDEKKMSTIIGLTTGVCIALVVSIASARPAEGNTSPERSGLQSGAKHGILRSVASPPAVFRQ